MATETLTYDMLVELWRRNQPQIMYGTSDAIERGIVYYVPFGEDDAFFLVIHPDDLEQIKSMMPSHRFVHVRERTVLTIAST